MLALERSFVPFVALAGVIGSVAFLTERSQAQGGSDETVTFQARILRDGIPLSDTLAGVKFEVWTAETGGLLLWQEVGLRLASM